MKKIRYFFLMLLFACQAYFAVSKSMSFQIIQRDSPDRDIRDTSFMIEDGLFDYFFSKGIVLSNAPIVVSEGSKKDSYFLSRAKKEAELGGINYFLEIIVKFESSTSVGADDCFVGYIENLEWCVTDLKSEKEIGRGKLVPPKVSQIKNENASLKIFIKKFLESVNNCL